MPLAAEHAVGIAVVSYAGRVFVGLNGDERAAADLEVLRDGIAESLAELLALALRKRPSKRGRAGSVSLPAPSATTTRPRKVSLRRSTER